MFVRKLALGAAFLAAALSTSARAAEPGAPPTDYAQQARIYYAGEGHAFRSHVEFTAEGAVIRFEGEVKLKARPMSAKEQELRNEWIANVPLDIGDVDPGPRQEIIGRILDRTNPLNVIRTVPQALASDFEAWGSPMRFDAIWLDQNHPASE